MWTIQQFLLAIGILVALLCYPLAFLRFFRAKLARPPLENASLFQDVVKKAIDNQLAMRQLTPDERLDLHRSVQAMVTSSESRPVAHVETRTPLLESPREKRDIRATPSSG